MQPEASSNSTLPSFTDAVATFTTFLGREGASAQLLWVDREDVTSHRRQIWVRTGDASEAARRAEARYEAGREKGLGVSLRAVCKVGESTACYVWVPKDGGKNGVITDCEKSVTTRFITIAEYFAIQRLRSRLAA